MTSLRRTILFWMALLLLLVGTISAAVTYGYVKDETQTSFDSEIKQIAQFLQNEETVDAPPRDALATPDPNNLFLIQIWDSDGTLARTSDKTVSAVAPQITGFTTQNLGHADWRSYSIVNAQQVIRVSLPLDERNEQASAAALQIAIPIAVIIPLSWLILSLLIDRILSRLDRAAEQVRTRNAGDRSQISLVNIPREIVPFVESINTHVADVRAQTEQQKRFLSDAAHELRTPLTALSIQLDNLKTVMKNEDQRQRLAAAEGGSRRANRLVSRLLQLARHDSHPPAFDDRKDRPASILKGVIASLETQSNAAEINIDSQFEVDGGVALPVRDFSQVCEVVVENAIRYTPQKSVITVGLKTENGQFQVTITDQGPGIDPKKLPHVFERFYRASPHTTQGTGLGLSIAQAICDNRGWKIHLENAEGRKGLIAIISGKVEAP